jgi:LEA14-like dessication related protein
MNPNRADLPLKGAAYTVHLEGREIVTGVTNDLPTIPGYGEAIVTLNATLNWLEGLGLINDLAQQPANGVSYEIKVKLDVGMLMPAIRITDSGTLSLNNLDPA